MSTTNHQHLLIVEDDQDIKNILTTLFTAEGYSVTAINGTPDILQTVRETGPDLIITDYILEGINGGEYCAQLKRDAETAHLPVIILSGFSRVLASLGDYGADAVIPKPFDNNMLLTTVKELLTAR